MKHLKILLAAGALLISPIAVSGAFAQGTDALEAACNASEDFPNDQCPALSADAEDLLSAEQIAYLTAIISGDDAATDEAGGALSPDDQNGVVQFFVEFTENL